MSPSDSEGASPSLQAALSSNDTLPSSSSSLATQSLAQLSSSNSGGESVGDIVQRLLSSSSFAPTQSSAAPSSRLSSASAAASSQPTPSRPSRTRAAGRRTAQVEETTKPVRRQKLQEEKLKHKRLFETSVEVIQTAAGYAGKKYKCKGCGTIRATEILIKNHAANCGKPFKGKRRRKNGASKFTCNQCHWSAGTQAALAKHRRDEHIPVGRVRPNRCTTCNKSFTASKNLKRHLLLHMRRVFTCSTCNLEFNREDNLKRHLSSHLAVPLGQAGNGRTQSQLEVDQVDDGSHEAVPLCQAGNGGTQSQIEDEQVDVRGEPEQVEQVERSRWDKFVVDENGASSSDDEELHHGPQGLSEAEEARNRRLSVLSNLLTAYGRSCGESEAEVARVQACLRERMCQPYNQYGASASDTSGLHTRASSMTVESEVIMIITLRRSPKSNCFNQEGSEGMADTVHLQLKPGLQYVIDVPMANSPLQPALTPDPTPSIPKAVSERTFSCNVCGKEFRDYFNLTDHFQRVHTVKENGFTCRHENLSFLYANLAHENLNWKLILYQFTLP